MSGYTTDSTYCYTVRFSFPRFYCDHRISNYNLVNDNHFTLRSISSRAHRLSCRSLEQSQNSACQDQDGADHGGCACIAEVARAAVQFAGGVCAGLLGFLTEFQRFFRVVALCFGEAAFSERFDTDAASLELHLHFSASDRKRTRWNFRHRPCAQNSPFLAPYTL